VANLAEYRNQVIDEFAKKLCDKSTLFKHIESDDYGIISEREILEIAEKMKNE
jgi:hypothetical protein